MFLRGFFSLIILLPLPLSNIAIFFCTVFGAILCNSNLDEVLSVTFYAKVSTFGDLIFITRTG